MSPQGKEGDYQQPGIYTETATKECKNSVTCEGIYCGYCSTGFKCDHTYDPDTGVAAAGQPPKITVKTEACDKPVICPGTYCKKEYCPPGMVYADPK